MEIQSVFYSIGFFFLFTAIGYFIINYLNITLAINAIIYFSIAIILFLIGDYLRRIDV
jgi:uncharacterized membrane protein YiaA